MKRRYSQLHLIPLIVVVLALFGSVTFWPVETIGRGKEILGHGNPETIPLLFLIFQKWLHYLCLISSTFNREPAVAVFLSIFSIYNFLFMFNNIRNFYFWPIAILELNRLKEQKARARVPDDPPLVSVIIPGKNEVKTIVQTVKSALVQNYPLNKIVIVDDGSDDGMSDLLIRTFGFENSPSDMECLRQNPDLPVKGVIKKVLKAQGHLYLIIKENAGKGYAMNEGINFCREEKFVCVLDADTIPDTDGILSLVFPMIEEPRLKIVSGRNQFINGCSVDEGVVVRQVIPRGFLLILQVRQFFRANCNKSFFNFLNAQKVLVGNFSCYSRDLVVHLNGFAERGLTEDYDFNMHAHQLNGQGEKILIKSIVTARGWTQAPYSLKGVFHQRVRWAGGILASTIKYRKMAFQANTKFMGLYAIPADWFRFLMFPINFIVNFLMTPFILYVVFFTSTGKPVVLDLFYYFYLPGFALFFIFDVIVVNFLDWKFIQSYPKKIDYIFMTFFCIFTGWFFESIMMVCNLVGYWRALAGYGSWGKSERMALPVTTGSAKTST